MRTLISRIWRKTYSAAAQKIVNSYLRKDRKYSYKGLHLIIYKGVFHPGFYRSTKLFADWLEQKELGGKSVLELGCGSGLLSLVAARRGASVTAVDINPKAVENVILNARSNNLTIKAKQSDLFSALSDEPFDIVLINPPYFPKTPGNFYEHAWFCGPQFEYFEMFFSQLIKRNEGEAWYMILSDSCDLATIKSIALKFGFRFEEDISKKIWGEQFYIFKIVCTKQ
jgi:release factor glutamine methyltransferase